MSHSSKGKHQGDKARDEQPYDVKFEVIPETLTDSFLKLFPSYPGGLHCSSKGGSVLRKLMAENAEQYFRVKPRPDDIWLLTFPKTGTVKFSFREKMSCNNIQRWPSLC